MKYLGAGLLVLGTATLAACDFPTESPRIEQRWMVPVKSTGIAVTELLPGEITVSGVEFSLDLPSFSASRTLGELCATCVNGGTGPAPAFAGTFTAAQDLPTGVSSTVFTSGAVTVAVLNGFSFDPLAGGGSAVVTLSDGAAGRELGRATFTSLDPGATASKVVELGEGLVNQRLVASASITSPGGATATLDTSQPFLVSVKPDSLLASYATVFVDAKEVELTEVELDVGGLDSSITDRILEGRAELEFVNPFGVSVDATFEIRYPGGTLTRTVEIPAEPLSHATLSYTGDELRSFLGQEGVLLRGEGIVWADPGSITVRPTQRLAITAKLDLTLVIG